jgi:hypothetical protein
MSLRRLIKNYTSELDQLLGKLQKKYPLSDSQKAEKTKHENIVKARGKSNTRGHAGPLKKQTKIIHID